MLIPRHHTQEFDLAEISAVFQDTGFPLVEEYFAYVSVGLNVDRYKGRLWAGRDPQAVWDAIGQCLEGFRVRALEMEATVSVPLHQPPRYNEFAVNSDVRTIF